MKIVQRLKSTLVCKTDAEANVDASACLKSSSTWHVAGTVLTIGFCLFLFWPMLVGKAEAGFRDSASLYQPLFEWTRDQWLAGQIPLWCSFDNWGCPVVADAATSVFYPGKLLFLIRGVPFSILFGVYLCGHVLLAVLGSRWCAEKIGLGAAAQWLSAIGYGFSGYLLFQTCNVIFLVGAAWLPWAFGSLCLLQNAIQNLLDKEIGFRKVFPSTVAFAAVLALMVLGGDPQIALHAGLVAVIWSIASCIRSELGQRWRLAMTALLVLTTTATFAFALSAVQVLPSLEWAELSERVSGDDRSRLTFARPEPGTSRDSAYQFSFPPWSVIELVWPNVLGKFDFATNWRWGDSIAGADRVWTGSIYIGTLLFLLSLAWVFCGPKNRMDYLLILTACLFLLGSFGWYGLGWVFKELQLMRGGLGFGPSLGEPTGGVYWILEQMVPGYFSFRYPAKLVVVALLPICLLGGRGLDHLTTSQLDSDKPNRGTCVAFRTGLIRFVRLAIVVSVAIAAVCYLAGGKPSKEIAWSMMHVMVVLGAFLVLLSFFGMRRLSVLAFSRLTVLLCSLELVLAVGWTVCAVEKQEIPSRDHLKSSGIYRPRVMEDVRQYESWDDLAVQLDVDRQSLYPKHHLLIDQRLVGSFHSIQPMDISILLNELAQMELPEQERVLGALGITARIEVDKTERHSRHKARLAKVPGRGRFYIAEHVKCFPEIDSRNRTEVVRRTREFCDMVSNAENRPASVVQVECAPNTVAGLDQQGSVELSVVEDTQHLIKLRYSSPGSRLIVVADYDDGNWIARRVSPDGTRVPLKGIRANRIQRGYLAPPGNYEIEIVYKPTSFYRGAWISCLAWLMVVGYLIPWHRRQ